MDASYDLHHLMTGFDDPALGTQQTFRAIFHALSRPGNIFRINSKLAAPSALNPAAAAICLTFFNYETPVWTDLNWNCSSIEWFQFQCGCSIVTEPCMASFALITKPARMPPLDHFRIGDDEHPEKSATLIIQVDGLSTDKGRTLTGPGIKNSAKLAPKGLPVDFWHQWQQQSCLYPLGVDVLFTWCDLLTGLPRTTRVQ